VSGITTHVLDLSRGRPASGVPVVLSIKDDSGWRELGRGQTDADGRAKTLLPPGALAPGAYRIVFDTAHYFHTWGVDGFYPEVIVTFHVKEDGHYHVPLLLSPFGYSTYRGS
jgi:5-hydroxyisourate hydrolase